MTNEEIQAGRWQASELRRKAEAWRKSKPDSHLADILDELAAKLDEAMGQAEARARQG